MAKLKKDPIAEADLQHFVNNDSDFSFEMEVLHRLRELEFGCSHAGTYQDPVSGKIRQFDIRASRRRGLWTLALAIECKNLRPNFPLLLSAVPRTKDEAFHEVIHHPPGPWPSVRIHDVRSGSLYKAGEMVAKKTDQVGRELSGDLVSDDGETFERLNQAVNSCKDLVKRSVTGGAGTESRFEAIVPVLVVPGGRLWQIEYTESGAVVGSPRSVTRSSLFLNHTWHAMHHLVGDVRYRLSHFEIITLDGLSEILPDWLSESGFFAGCLA